MKFLTEYRHSGAVAQLLTEIKGIVTRPWNIMEICGGQTHSLVRNGIIDMLPGEITMIHGPGCPVCVTPVAMIDKAIELSRHPEVIICSFGDMLRVPGSSVNLLQAKAQGADVRIVYSPLEAVTLAQNHPERQVVFFAVGFETTAPANALSVILANKLGLKNYSILVSHVLVPPAMEAILSDKENSIHAFLGAGHVCTVMGYREYYSVAEKYQVPIVVTGFEPVDLLQGILMSVRQLEAGYYKVENQYARVVQEKGNPDAIRMIDEVFRVADREWRGLGSIPNSGYELNARYQLFDASIRFALKDSSGHESKECIAGAILKGLKKPFDCPAFGTTCTPLNPLGAPMVSTEGACAAYYHYAQHKELLS